jgi:hypothetical protein
MGKQWESSTGRPCTDNRDWPEYNEELVVRGEFLLDLKWVNSMDKELEKMNKGKRGAPFEFPESLIRLQAVWNQWVSYRFIEGMTRQLVAVAKLPNYNDYSTANRRVNAMDTNIKLPTQGFVSAACDGSGIKLDHAGEYRQNKYRGTKSKKWLRVTITANPYTKELLFCDVRIEEKGQDSEPTIAMKHLNTLWELGYTVDKFWGDGAFDVIDLYNLLEEHGTESAIPLPKNASANAHGSMRRQREVFFFQTHCWSDWAREKEYGKRWLGTEVMFSAVKTVFGEKTKAKSVETACKEAERRFWAYAEMCRYAKN